MNTFGKIIMNPSEEYSEKKRKWQGVPSIEKTGKRLWATWFSGGKMEPSMKNYAIVAYSDDDGKTWTEPAFVIDGKKEYKYRIMDPELCLDNRGRLWLYWCKDIYSEEAKETDYTSEGRDITEFYFVHLEQWGMYCENPEADEPVWSEPQFMCKGFAKNKMEILDNGRWLFSLYDSKGDDTFCINFAVSDDEGKTFSETEKIVKAEKGFCEPMTVKLNDGTLWCLIRTYTGYLYESFSKDNGKSWTTPEKSDIPNPSTRFYIGRLKSGELMLINTPSDKFFDRNKLVVSLSEDEGKTWKYDFLIDDRQLVSYPDAALDDDGNVYIIYDCQRDNRYMIDENDPMKSNSAKEILYAKITVEDIKAGKLVSPDSRLKQIISKVNYSSRELDK
ncbi:MAG: exo-alpha-sialidase [Clostridia bacterium]|nr:exo-alpha-sialidase [Clostridia bacterium]